MIHSLLTVWLLEPLPFFFTLKLARSLLPLGQALGIPKPTLSPPLLFVFPRKPLWIQRRFLSVCSDWELALRGVRVEAGEPLAGFPSHPLSSQEHSRAPTTGAGQDLSCLSLGSDHGFSPPLPLAHPEPGALPGTKLNIIWRQAPLPQMIHGTQGEEGSVG